MSDQITNRAALAQDIMDLYYQDFKDDNEQHFDIEFFDRQVDDAYAAILREEYIEQYNMLRNEGRGRIDIVTFDSSWLKSELVDLKKHESGLWFVELSQKVFSFPFDQSNVGIQDVRSGKYDADCNFIRDNPDSAWKNKHLPKTRGLTFWWPEDGKVFFDNDCCKQARVLYIPSGGKDLEMQQGVANQIKEYVLRLMKFAKDGVVTDMTNDSNSNQGAQTETNKETLQ